MATAAPVGARVYHLGPVAQIPTGEGRMFRVGDRAIAVFRSRTGEVYATQAFCPHRGGPLADGIIGAGRVICPLHGFQFELATGRPVGNTCAALATYPVSVSEAGEILLRLSPASGHSPQADRACPRASP